MGRVEGAILALGGAVIWSHCHLQQQQCQQRHLAGILQDTLEAATQNPPIPQNPKLPVFRWDLGRNTTLKKMNVILRDLLQDKPKYEEGRLSPGPTPIPLCPGSPAGPPLADAMPLVTSLTSLGLNRMPSMILMAEVGVLVVFTFFSSFFFLGLGGGAVYTSWTFLIPHSPSPPSPS